MSFDMFSGKQNDDMDPNYIYPMPYVDPTMYANPYGMNGSAYPGYQMDPNMAMGGYMTYMNPYMNNPVMSGQQQQQQQNQINNDDCNFEDMDENMFMQNQMPGMMPMMPPGMMMPGMMPMMPPGMMMPGMMPMMPPGMMMPGMMPYMMMPGMPQIHLEEFDEEEM
ncbi:hypothetical protein [Romboutsia lituseburensis]|uniref:hypothetical protein n=1 Tax=Romboutsia lituseburensis TaxID=1537 RepID=UPI00215A6873|nr:hypothetical protein [Romboutsia lituseburensis]MCR8745682.1 hypothetical protein [Romboutsia lituseburensis]